MKFATEIYKYLVEVKNTSNALKEMYQLLGNNTNNKDFVNSFKFM